MQAIQKKYKGKTDPASREAMSRETMELYRKHGTNPFASCLPILLQSPIFFALFRVLIELVPQVADGAMAPIGPMTPELAAVGRDATIFGAPLSGDFMQADGNIHIQIVSVVLIIAMSRHDVPHAAPADHEEHAAGGARRARWPSSRRSCSTSCR